MGAGTQAPYLFWREPVKLSRDIYGGNPFSESVEVSKWLNTLTRPGETIAVLGSEPEIFFYSKRRSATGHIYMYGLMEPHNFSRRMQNDAIREIDEADPRIVIYIQCEASWLRHSASETKIFEWWDQAVKEGRYVKIGIVDIFRQGTVFRFDEKMKDYHPAGSSQMFIFERNKDLP